MPVSAYSQRINRFDARCKKFAKAVDEMYEAPRSRDMDRPHMEELLIKLIRLKASSSLRPDAHKYGVYAPEEVERVTSEYLSLSREEQTRRVATAIRRELELAAAVIENDMAEQLEQQRQGIEEHRQYLLRIGFLESTD